jgi:dTDP-4-amino-4,6-dideoxygalactose transaminase
MNEVQAAFGLLQLKHIDENIAKRKAVANLYRKHLSNIKGIRFLNDVEHVTHTYSYFPILIDEKEYGKTRDELYEELKRNSIFSRRYFYPLISQFPSYRGLSSATPENLPVAEQVSKQVICLPIYPELGVSEIERIIKIL